MKTKRLKPTFYTEGGGRAWGGPSPAETARLHDESGASSLQVPHGTPIGQHWRSG